MSQKSRIRWLCRRGMKELDVLLERFLATAFDDLTAEEVDAFEQLLQSEDPDLYDLLAQKTTPANTMQADLIKRIGACARLR